MKKFVNNKRNIVLISTLLATTIFVGCSSEKTDTTSDNTGFTNEQTKEQQTTDEVTILRIATTTSLDNTGLLAELEADFESKYPYDVEYTVVGSGAAIEAGASGEADAIFVHSKKAEEELVADGTSLGRNTFMYNYFEIVGVEPLESTEYEDVLNEIRENKTFVSRGDDSGTDVKEKAMWGDDLPKDYVETGKGMLDTLIMTDELGGYTLTDDATFIANQDKFDLVEVYKDESFKNEYSYHCINPELNEYINGQGAQDFLTYLETPETQELIGTFGEEEFGKPLFTLTNE